MVVRGLRLAMRYLNVAEKNDAAKNIAGHLSRGTARRREGLSTYNKIYEFEANVFGQKSTMIMTSVSGHLLGYEFVGSYKVWQSCNPLALFDAPVVKACSDDYQKIKQTLERETRGCQGLIIWTDCDREGENIGFEIIQVCSQIKSNLKIYRAKFSEITAASVERALRTLGAPDKNVSDAVDVRQELDLRIGAAFTRFQTLRLQKVFPAQLASSLVSYGSCQFPTLGFVVERYRAVESFVPENFWKIAVSHTLNDLTVEFSWKRNRLFDEQACIVIHDMCVENPTATVKSVKSKPKSKWRPLPLDTIEMEKLGSRKLRINAKEVMKIAEKLYTQGIISYPRTETNIYPKELNLNNLVNIQLEDSEWGSFAKRIIDSGGATPRQGKKSDQAHPPIHPTKHVTNLSGNEKRVYELIVRSFLACCYKDAQGQETTVDIEIAGEKFGASGLMILARNYLDVYPYDKWSAKEIHIYEEGQMFTPTTLDVASGQTTAPALLTEADLIALMEKHGIGTDATHADHIETIKNRSYVALADNIHFVPGLLGMGLVEGYDSMGLSFSKPNLRAGLEADLKEVCEGRKSPQDVLSQQVATYRNVYITVSQEALKIDRALSERFNQQPQNESSNTPSYSPSVMKCNKCRSDMTLRTKKDNQGFFVSCMSYPQCKNAIWFPSIVETVSVTEETCQTCGPSYLKLKFVWKNRSLEHLYPSPFISCIGGCDPNFLQSLSINNAIRSTPSQTTNHTDSGFGNDSRLSQSTVSSSNTNLSNQRTTQNNYNAVRSNNSQPSSQNNRNNQAGSFRSDFFNGTNNSSFINYSNQRNQNPQNSNPNQNPSNDDNHVVCNCGEPALLLTVRKSSPNMGRQFYKCPKPNGGCNFFLWATSEESGVETDSNNRNTGWGNTTQNNWGSNSNSVADPGGGRSDTDIPQCHCNQPSKKITVSKEGPNKGRCFFGCSNSIANRCKFFQWADDQINSVDSQPSTSWSSTTTSGGTNRGQESRRGGRPTGERGRATGERGRATGERARKRCGNCREEGHMRNKCPRLQ